MPDNKNNSNAPVTLDSLWAQYLTENRADLDTSEAIDKVVDAALGKAKPKPE